MENRDIIKTIRDNNSKTLTLNKPQLQELLEAIKETKTNIDGNYPSTDGFYTQDEIEEIKDIYQDFTAIFNKKEFLPKSTISKQRTCLSPRDLLALYLVMEVVAKDNMFPNGTQSLSEQNLIKLNQMLAIGMAKIEPNIRAIAKLNLANFEQVIAPVQATIVIDKYHDGGSSTINFSDKQDLFLKLRQDFKQIMQVFENANVVPLVQEARDILKNGI